MKFGAAFQTVVVGAALVYQQMPVWGGEGTSLIPFIGETTQEFEARKQGSRGVPSGGQGVVVKVPADSSGHFFVEPTLNGQRVRMLVDTGASLVTLTFEDAMSMLLRLTDRDFTLKVTTANGVVKAAPIQIAEVQVGNIKVRNVEALVLPPGRLSTSLLGMTFLKLLRAFEVSGQTLILHP